MEPIHYVRALRQWWRVIAILTLIGLLAAALSWTAPIDAYAATRTLVTDDATGESSSPDVVSLARAAFLSTNSEVLQRVAGVVGDDAADLSSRITATPDESLNGVFITATAATPAHAEEIAKTFADELVAYLDEQAGVRDQKARDAAQRQLDAALTTEQIAAAQGRLAELDSRGPPSAGLAPIGSISVESEGAGTSRALRALIGGLMGLLLGVVVALLLARFDTRIRVRDGAEAAFGVPVIAEVPALGRRLRKSHAIITSHDPESLSAEAYRGLRTALVVAANARKQASVVSRTGRRSGQSESSAASKGSVVMVVSPGMNEGKTTTAANLAVAYAETGRSVLLLGCDLRRPGLHTFFDLTESPGLTDVFSATGGSRSLESVVRETPYPGVRIATSGDPVKHAGEYLTRGLNVIESARDLADVVIIDTAPLLATDDAAVLMPIVETVVIVCKSDLTRKESATRARELLDRLQAPVAGVALIAAKQLATARSYYRYRSEYRSRRPGAREQEPLPSDAIDVQSRSDAQLHEESWHLSNGVGDASNGQSTSDATESRSSVEETEGKAAANGAGDLSPRCPTRTE